MRVPAYEQCESLKNSVGGGHALGGDDRFRTPAGGSVRREAGIADLVEQRPITDTQGAGCLFAVPVVSLQDFQNDLALQFARGCPGQFLQRDGPIEIDVWIEILLFAGYQ